jgi:hypothetical protein
MIGTKTNDIENAAKKIAAKGFVKRSQGRFLVRSRENDLRPAAVSRSADGTIVCTCRDFRIAGNARCVHILAVPYAIALKNTEMLPALSQLPEPKKPTDQLRLIDNTESRLSGRGEQKDRNDARHASGFRHFGNIDLDSFRLENIRGKEMKQQNAATAVKPAEKISNENNVLDFSTTLSELRRSVEPEFIRQREGWSDREGRAHTVDYVEWHTVADILDKAAPSWSHTVKDIRQIGDIIAVTVAITIDGITREGIGTGRAKNELGIKKAEHDALKRAAVKFGIARDLYKHEKDQERAAADLLEDATAKTMADMITTKQLRMIHSLARERGIDANAECSAMTNCRIGELSKRAASAFIEHLLETEPGMPAVAMKKAG